MITYRFADERDMESIIDFINMVFSMLRVPHNFEEMLPKVYGQVNRHPEIHAIAEEDGKICGCLGLHVFPLTVCGETLRVGYLGSMSVHPRMRGQGVMKVLMEMQIAAGKERGLDMMVLGGQRQRYQYYGFETCGGTFGYSISAANVRHALGDVDAGGLTFTPMTQEDVPYALALYSTQSVCGARTEKNFLDCVRSYREKPMTIRKGGERVGYLVTTQDGASITEILTGDAAMLPAAVKGYALYSGARSLHVDAAPHDARLSEALAPICEGYTIAANSMLSVLNPAKVIGAYMRLAQTIAPLADGALTLAMGERGTVRIAVENGEISVAPAQGDAQITLDAREAHQLLFGFNRFAVPAQARHAAPANWFPLPYHIPEPDSF